MQGLRARLVASRPAAAAYAAAVAAMPASLIGLEGRVAAATIYPAKALGGVAVPSVRVDARGLAEPESGLRDRAVMLAIRRPGESAEGAFDAVAFTNRLDGSGSLARARLDGRYVVYEAPGVAPARLAAADFAPLEGPSVRVRMYEGGPILTGSRREGELTRFVRDLLRAHPRQRRFAPEDVFEVVPSPSFRRAVPAKHSAEHDAETLYGDGGHLLAASASTLRWMNAHLATAGERAIDMAAFRPNLILDGLPPNAEDVIAEAEAAGADGAVPISFASYCVRCDATRVDVATGGKPDRQPLAWLARERPPREGEPNSATFAVNAVVGRAAHGRTIRVGDSVRVTRERG